MNGGEKASPTFEKSARNIFIILDNNKIKKI
jgi:hypothetical protein